MQRRGARRSARWTWMPAVLAAALAACGTPSVPDRKLADEVSLAQYPPPPAGGERSALPKAVRALLKPQHLELVETSPLLARTPQPRIGFKVRAVSTPDALMKQEVEMVCAPHAVRFLRCRTLSVHGEGPTAARMVHQSLSVYGGLVEAANAFYFRHEGRLHEAVTQELTQLSPRADSKTWTGTPLDLDFVSTLGNEHHRQQSRTVCRPAKPPLPDRPPQLARFGKVEVFACGVQTDHTLTMLGWERRGDDYRDPGLPGGVLFFWIPEVGIALPAVLFGRAGPGLKSHRQPGIWFQVPSVLARYEFQFGDQP